MGDTIGTRAEEKVLQDLESREGFIGGAVEKAQEGTVFRVFIDQDLLDAEDVVPSVVTHMCSEVAAKHLGKEAKFGFAIVPMRQDTPHKEAKRLLEDFRGVIGVRSSESEDEWHLSISYDVDYMSDELVKKATIQAVTIVQRKTGYNAKLKVHLHRYKAMPKIELS